VDSRAPAICVEMQERGRVTLRHEWHPTRFKLYERPPSEATEPRNAKAADAPV